MALETILFQQDPFCYSGKDCYNKMALGNYYNPDQEALSKIIEQESNGCGDSPRPSLMAHGRDLFVRRPPPAVSPAEEPRQRKRKRTKRCKNKEEIETQRITHITVERNRRKQMNQYLALLRSLIPSSYVQRGDQASIVGGAINFVKELEQLLQFLESQKQVKKHQGPECCQSHVFNNFFFFPQYLTCPIRNKDSLSSINGMAEQLSTIATIEVTMVESQANIKVVSIKRPKQLVKLVIAFQSISLTILHLNITTVDDLVFYSLSVKVEEDCQLTTVNDIATAVHEILGMIQAEAMASRGL